MELVDALSSNSLLESDALLSAEPDSLYTFLSIIGR